MKILIVSEDIPHPHLGGLGKHALALAHALHRRGHVVDVLGNADRSIGAHPEQAGPGRFFGAISGHDRGWKERSLGAFTPVRVLLNVRKLKQAILNHASGYDVIHYHGHLPWVAAEIPDNIRFIQTRHDQGGDCMLNTRYLPSGQRCFALDPKSCASCATTKPNAFQTLMSAFAVRLMRRRSKQAFERHPVIFVSKFLQDGFAKVAGGVSFGNVVHNAVDEKVLLIALARAKTTADTQSHQIKLFSAGSVAAHKGYREFLELLQQQPLPASMTLAIAGDGPLLKALQKIDGTGDVSFLGWRSYDDTVAHVAKADAVVVPSVWDEPCATSILEALALGRPVYALARGGSPELRRYAAQAHADLLLFPDIASLVAALRKHAKKLPPATALVLEFSATMHEMAQDIERHYQLLPIFSTR